MFNSSTIVYTCDFLNNAKCEEGVIFSSQQQISLEVNNISINQSNNQNLFGRNDFELGRNDRNSFELINSMIEF